MTRLPHIDTTALQPGSEVEESSAQSVEQAAKRRAETRQRVIRAVEAYARKNGGCR